MNKKNSLLFQISLFFISIFLVINMIIIIQFFLDNYNNKMFHIKRYFDSTKLVFDSLDKKLNKESINKKLKKYYTELSNIDIQTLEQKAKKVEFKEDENLDIFIFNDKKYVHLRPPGKPRDRRRETSIQNDKLEFKSMSRIDRPIFREPKPIVLVDFLEVEKIKYFWLIILLFIDLLLIWFYYFLYKKLKPLITLKNNIVKFSRGDLNINTEVIGNDEISQVSNEFNEAIKKIRELSDSRKLFLRNILHELKTPITKGKLISDTLENNKKKTILQKSFLRLEYLLGEFVKLEEFGSGKINLVKKEYRVIDLLDQALDILLLDKSKVDIYPNSTKIYVDYEVFAIALKNLIDNSLKYNTNGRPEIFIRNDSLLIKNKGKSLKKNFEEYLKPFNREYESIDKGLGLGLYITNNVIKSHGYKLFYFYSKNYHIFKIQFINI